MLFPPIIWRRSSRAKRLSLKIDIQQSAVIVILPPRISKQQGLVLLQSQTAWVSQALKELPASALERGEVLLQGVYYSLIDNQRVKAQLGAGKVIQLGGCGYEQKEKYLKLFLQQQAQAILPHQAQQYGHAMGHIPEKITVRDARSRWGSCTRQGRIMLNWRLVMAPPEVARYVIVHELAHLRYFNHSLEFWAYVDQFCPEQKKGRINSEKWLKHHGVLLMRMI